jgi:hypothetical protein
MQNELLNNRIDAENEACHGSCLRNTRASLSFPVMTGVMPKKIEELDTTGQQYRTKNTEPIHITKYRIVKQRDVSKRLFLNSTLFQLYGMFEAAEMHYD